MLRPGERPIHGALSLSEYTLRRRFKRIYWLWPRVGALAGVKMLKKTILSTLVLAMLTGTALTAAGTADAQQYHRPPPGYDGNQPPPPPRQQHNNHHHHNNGGIIAGGVAAGILGGLIGGALVNNQNDGYSEPPPPPPRPRCWFEDRPVQNQYDDGWHHEQVRVCN
jgi:hypothetical protein